MNEYLRILGLNEDAGADEIHAAYLKLARKWHPDRFPEGPDRIEAEEKMTDINCAYNQLISHAHSMVPPNGMDRFQEVRFLIEAGQLSRARKLMTDMTLRDSEWNYHFGMMLYKRNDFKKAITYLSIAVHQSPDHEEYKKALQRAKLQCLRKRFQFIKKLCGFKQKKAI